MGHVEAGLRTYDKYSPFPEEMNRQFVGCVADLHFAPTEGARDNLLKEGKRPETIVVTGKHRHRRLKDHRAGRTTPTRFWSGQKAPGSSCSPPTAGRTWGSPCTACSDAALDCEEFPDVKMVYPVHLNPLVQNAAKAEFSGCGRVRLIAPLEVVEFQNLLARSTLILTDSGGIQEEAPSLGKPVIVLRDTTERPEGVAAGTAKLAGTDEETIYAMVRQLLTDEGEYQRMSQAVNPYGDGLASARIADAIAAWFQNRA